MHPTPSHATDEQLSARLDDQLAASETTAVDAHLGACQACALRLAELQAISHLLRSLPEVDPPRDFTIGPRLVSQAARVRRLERWYGWSRLAASAAAATFVLVVGANLYLEQARPAPPSATLSIAPRAAPAAPAAAPAAPVRQAAPAEAAGEAGAGQPTAPAVAPRTPAAGDAAMAEAASPVDRAASPVDRAAGQTGEGESGDRRAAGVASKGLEPAARPPDARPPAAQPSAVESPRLLQVAAVVAGTLAAAGVLAAIGLRAGLRRAMAHTIRREI